jgi:hypothetical protein
MRVGIQVGRLGHHVESRKQSQPLVENQIHDMAFAFGAGELQSQQREPCLRGRDHLAAGIAGLPNQAGQVAIHQHRQKQEQTSQLSREVAWGQGEFAAIGDGSGRGKEGRGTLFILAPGQAGEAFFVQDLPDGGGTQGSLLGLQGACDVVDGEVLLTHAQDQFAGGIFLGLRMRAALQFTEEVGLGAAEMMTQDAKRARGVAEAPGDVRRGKTFDEVGPEGLVLALRGGGGFEEEPGVRG